MAKSQTSYATNASNNLMNQAQGLVQPWTQSFGTQYQTAIGNRDSLYGGTLLPTVQGELKYGGYDPTTLANLRGETQNMADTGGYNPDQINQISQGYGNFAQTGGMTQAQQQAFMRQGSEGVTANYGALQNQAKQAGIATGGLGTAGAISQMARQGTQAQGQATLNSQVALNQLLTQNKLAGLGGEASFAGQVAGARQTGLAQQLGLESGVQQGALSATNIMNQLYNTQTGEISDMGNKILSSLGLQFGSEAEAIQALTALSQNPGAFQTVYGDILAGGAVAAGAAKAA